MYVKDHLLFTILDWDQGILRLEHEPYGQIDQARLAERNQMLADKFYSLLESATREDVLVYEAVPTIYAHLPEKSGYPAGSWWDVLAADGRMKSDGFMIHYREHETPIERMLAESRKPSANRESSSQFRRSKPLRSTASVLNWPTSPRSGG